MADSDASLPDSVAEEDEPSLPESIGAEDGPGDLPPDVEENAGKLSECCKAMCLTKFDGAKLQTHLANFDSEKLGDRRQKLYQEVRQIHDSSKVLGGHNMRWTILNQPVCRVFWEKAYGIGHGQVDKLLAFARAGHTHVPGAAPKQARSTPAQDTLDVWFLALYNQLAEPLAVPGSGDTVVGAVEEEGQHEIVEDATHPLYLASINAERGGKQGPVKVPRRYLNFSSDHDLYLFYVQDEVLDKQCSKSTFTKGWRSWKNYLPLKNAGQQSKCITCASLSEARVQATDADSRAELDKQKKDHLAVVMADRRINVRGNKMSAAPEVWMKDQNGEKAMKLMLDGMDQAKFALPRVTRLQGTSLLAKSWRPSVHMTGVIIWGLLEMYVIMPPDCPKDSNMNSTVVAFALDKAAQLLRDSGPDKGFPPNLILSLDNTPREGKNSLFASFCSWLVSSQLFHCVQCEYLQVDHTHNELDQRFSSMASVIKQADTVEDLTELRDYLATHMRPAQGRELFVELLPNTWDFRQWFESLNMHVQGLTSTHVQPYANHVWRFQPRFLVIEDEEIEVHHPEWQRLAESPMDVILTVKQFMSSPARSQKPQLQLGAPSSDSSLRAYVHEI